MGPARQRRTEANQGDLLGFAHTPMSNMTAFDDAPHRSRRLTVKSNIGRSATVAQRGESQLLLSFINGLLRALDSHDDPTTSPASGTLQKDDRRHLTTR